MRDDSTQDRRLNAAKALAEILRPHEHSITDEGAAQRLADALDAGGPDPAQMITQAHTLDALFNRLLIKSMRHHSDKVRAAHPNLDYLDADLMRLALRTQSQCRQTATALRGIVEYTGRADKSRDRENKLPSWNHENKLNNGSNSE